MTKPELITLARTARSVDDLLALARAHNVALTPKEAEAALARLQPTNAALTDDELDNVAGGCSEERDDNGSPNHNLIIR